MEETIDTGKTPVNNVEYVNALNKSIAQAENNEFIVFSMEAFMKYNPAVTQ
jgi:hypothetical protein